MVKSKRVGQHANARWKPGTFQQQHKLLTEGSFALKVGESPRGVTPRQTKLLIIDCGHDVHRRRCSKHVQSSYCYPKFSIGAELARGCCLTDNASTSPAPT
jgi:hypothetical protein